MNACPCTRAGQIPLNVIEVIILAILVLTSWLATFQHAPWDNDCGERRKPNGQINGKCHWSMGSQELVGFAKYFSPQIHPAKGVTHTR